MCKVLSKFCTSCQKSFDFFNMYAKKFVEIDANCKNFDIIFQKYAKFSRKIFAGCKFIHFFQENFCENLTSFFL